MVVPFHPSRPDGRSDRVVVYDLVADAEPETLFAYEDLAAALQDGIETPITRPRIYRAVRQANKDLLTKDQRYVAAVPGRGYRMVRAADQIVLAGERKTRARRQMDYGISLLRGIRLDELTEAQRKLALGNLMIADGLYRMIESTERRQNRQDAVLASVIRTQSEFAARLEKIETSEPQGATGLPGLA